MGLQTSGMDLLRRVCGARWRWRTAVFGHRAFLRLCDTVLFAAVPCRCLVWQPSDPTPVRRDTAAETSASSRQHRPTDATHRQDGGGVAMYRTGAGSVHRARRAPCRAGHVRLRSPYRSPHRWCEEGCLQLRQTRPLRRVGLPPIGGVYIGLHAERHAAPAKYRANARPQGAQKEFLALILDRFISMTDCRTCRSAKRHWREADPRPYG